MRKSLLYGKVLGFSESMSSGALESFFEAARHRTVEKGEYVLEQGSLCKSIYFVERGYLRAFVCREGFEINTDFIFEDNFGTSLKSLRMDVPTETSIVAGEATELYEFNKNKLLELYKKFPEIESFGRKLLEHLLMEQEEYIHMIKIMSAIERYRYLEQYKPEIIKRVSLSQICSYLGLARETLSRIRKTK